MIADGCEHLGAALVLVRRGLGAREGGEGGVVRTAEHGRPGGGGVVDGLLDAIDGALTDRRVGGHGILVRTDPQHGGGGHAQTMKVAPEAAVGLLILARHEELDAVIANGLEAVDHGKKVVRNGAGPGEEIEADGVHNR
jgi:hypothetical protein